ncbi:zinc finger protein weckle [Drosophila eugracilis]|uniref:zinc finger protein weckle n=1 Tax=Drosophila eugracilis TaxID=29029 RepID=UPI0007E77635|nr:zinc finger protein weckle [Drosophila eugracilis]
MGVPTSDWLYWCRLCARDDVVYKVRQRDESLVRIINKCFNVKIILEEPELSSMLCEECFSVIGQLLTFSESVEKVQGIFELLRHSEPLDSQDLDELRQDYGLPPTCKQELEFLEIDDQEDKYSLEELEISDHSTLLSPDAQTNSVPMQNNSTKSKRQLEEEYLSDQSSAPSTNIQSTHSRTAKKRRASDYELEEYGLHDDELVLTEDKTTSIQPEKRKRGRPKGSGNKQPRLDDSKNLSTRKANSIDKVKPQDKTSKYSLSPQDGSQSSSIADFSCKACNESFMSFMALRRHRHDMHGGPKKFVCDSCGKGLKTFTSLVEHKLVHTDEKPCVCPVCNAAFKNKARLRVHSQTHGDPKFKCNICGKMLQTRAILNKHKYVHTEERRFKCEICGNGCKNSTALKIHLLGHTGLRPYVCKYCGKAFASNTNCRSHKWKKHPEEAANEDESESSRVAVPTLEELRAITREMAKSRKET